MSVLTIRNVPTEIHQALRILAANNGRSMEAEAREILRKAVTVQDNVRLGDALSNIGRKCGLTNEDFEALEEVLKKEPAEPMSFE